MFSDYAQKHPAVVSVQNYQPDIVCLVWLWQFLRLQLNVLIVAWTAFAA